MAKDASGVGVQEGRRTTLLGAGQCRSCAGVHGLCLEGEGRPAAVGLAGLADYCACPRLEGAPGGGDDCQRDRGQCDDPVELRCEDCSHLRVLLGFWSGKPTRSSGGCL